MALDVQPMPCIWAPPRRRYVTIRYHASCILVQLFGGYARVHNLTHVEYLPRGYVHVYDLDYGRPGVVLSGPSPPLME